MNSIVLILGLVAFARAAPAELDLHLDRLPIRPHDNQDFGDHDNQDFGDHHNLVRVISDLREGPVIAEYNYRLELDNGVVQEQSGTAGSAGQSNAQGSFTFVGDDGITYTVTYTADENGFNAQGNHLPQAPAHVEQLLRIAEEQRAAGIQFDDQGFEIQNGQN